MTLDLLDAERKFHAFLASHRHSLHGDINHDGSRFHYCKCPRGSSTDARYKFYPDGIASGYFKCWRCNIEADFCSKNKNECSPAEWQQHIERMNKANIQNARELEKRHSTAAKEAQRIWAMCTPVTDANSVPYLRIKHVQAYGLRIVPHDFEYQVYPPVIENGKEKVLKVHKDNLIVPIFNTTNEIINLENIFIEQKSGKYAKRPLTGGRKSGGYYVIGKVNDPSGIIYLSESYSTSASIHETTEAPTVVTFSCGNIANVAKIFRTKYPLAHIVICADDDRWNKDPKLRDAGLKAAKKACSTIKGVKYMLPKFGVLNLSEKKLAESMPTDINDLFVNLLVNGLDRTDALDIVRQQIQTNLDESIMSEINTDQKENLSDGSKQSKTSSILYRCLSDIKSTPINWLWKGRIARGKITIIAGNPGLGKSQLTSSITAIVTTGGKWPVDGITCIQGGVIILSAEDDPEDTIRPRLEASGADLKKIFFIDAIQEKEGANNQTRRVFNLKADIARLGGMLEELTVKGCAISLVIIDPITAYLGDTDSYKNAEVRSLLTPLSELASKHQVAIIGVSHLNKGGNTEALMRVSGSLAFVAAARAAFLVAQDDENENKRLFLPLKNNIGNDKTGLAFKIEPHTLENGIETSRVIWENETVLKTADDIMATSNQNDKDASSEAEEFLCDALADTPRPVKDLQKEADDAGHSWATVRRAKKTLCIRAKKDGMEGGWVWELPPKVLKSAEGAHQNYMSTFGGNEHLRQNLNSSISDCEII